MFLRGDFHIHSTASDGALSPQEIILLAKDRNIDTIAIADHNSVAAIIEASEAGKQWGISVIPAVELSTRFNGESIHILGYFRDMSFNDPTFQHIIALVKNHKAMEASNIIGGFRGSHSANRHISVFEGIQLLRYFRAAVVLAHPVRISEKNLPELLALPFDGIEAKYGHSSEYSTKLFIETALNRFSFYTGGSDFHTNKMRDEKHCIIGEPCLNSLEIRRFLKNSGALVMGAGNQDRDLNRCMPYY
jgi:predicted metal-dependent phosphoesterase TrpH